MINLPMSELVVIINDVINKDGEFRLYPKGTSMLPLIVQGDDSVVLVKPSLLLVGDIVLYKRKNGSFILHRIVKINGNDLVICGDNQTTLEYGITKDDVIAKVSAIYKKEVLINGNVGNKKFYLFSLKLKRIFLPIALKIKRVLKNPSLIWRKIKGEKH